jgi:hypothetical protein
MAMFAQDFQDLWTLGIQNNATPDDIEILFLRIAREAAHHATCTGDFEIFGSASQKHWRTICRLTCCNVSDVTLKPNLNKSHALCLTRAGLGQEFCPADSTLSKDAYRAVAIALSLLTKKLITPKCACYTLFYQKKKGRFKLTAEAERLLTSCNVNWPPMGCRPVVIEHNRHRLLTKPVLLPIVIGGEAPHDPMEIDQPDRRPQVDPKDDNTIIISNSLEQISFRGDDDEEFFWHSFLDELLVVPGDLFPNYLPSSSQYEEQSGEPEIPIMDFLEWPGIF